MAKKVGELFVELAVDAASGNLSVRQLVTALGDLDVASAGSVGVMAKVGEQIYQMGRAAMSASLELTALHDITGADPRIIQQWDKAAAKITGSTGVIKSALLSFNRIQSDVALNKGLPPNLAYLGTSVFKPDPNNPGKMALKDVFEMLRDFSAPGSIFHSRSRLQQEGTLRELFGGQGDQMFRVIQALSEGRLHPEREPAMNDRQIRDLNRVNTDWIDVQQRMTGVFQDFLISGRAVADVLESISKKLYVIDSWLQSKQGQNTMSSFGWSVNDIVKNLGNPYLIGKDWGGLVGKTYFQSVTAPKTVAPGELKLSNLKGTIDINLTQDGRHVQTKTVHLDGKPTFRDLLNATTVQGLTP